MTETMEKLPWGWAEIESVMSNFDHEINSEIAERLKTGHYISSYPGWNFHAYIWFADGSYRAEIKRYCSHQTTLVSESLMEIMQEASKRWGSD